MGLDQYAWSRRPHDNKDDHDEFAYWRKHNRLQGWMENLWEEKGFSGNLNCNELPLTLEDLDNLEAALNNKELPETQGFFYGHDSYEEYDHPEWGYKEVDMAFIEEARRRINKGMNVYYSCWW